MQIQGQGLFLLSMSSKRLTSTLSLTKLFSPPNGFYKERKQDFKFRDTIHMDKAITHRTGATYFHGLHPLMIGAKLQFCTKKPVCIYPVVFSPYGITSLHLVEKQPCHLEVASHFSLAHQFSSF